MIILTGATGFLGSAILKKLIDEHYEVVCTYRKSSNFSRVLEIKEKCDWIDTSEFELNKLFSQNHIETIIHCATFYGRDASQFVSVYESNFSFPMMLVKLAQKYNVNYFINTDSFFTKKIGNNINIQQQVYMDSYTKSKYFFREVLRTNIDKCNFSFINLMLEQVYGDDSGKGKFVDFLKTNLINHVKTIPLSPGIQKRDWIHVDDVVSAYSCVLTNLSKFQRKNFYDFSVGTGVSISLKDFCLLMKEEAKSNSNLEFGALDMMPGELMNSVADATNLKKIGWRPTITIEKGIARIFKNENNFDSYSYL